jgi:putative transposase
MKRSRFTEEQIIKVLKQAEGGTPTKEVCRQLEQENARLKRMCADLMLDNQILKDVNSKKW